MKCPKCNHDIDDKMLVCPNCKKVLKLVCPKCNTINKKNTCQKCGFVIISKCHNCGKINQTINSKCSKCGFSTYTSVAIASSDIDEFACITIEFPNLAEIKNALKSIKLTEKFKTNLYDLIANYATSIGVSREIIENIHVIRFNKSNSFKSSAMSAIDAAIEIQNKITELNFKLKTAANASLKCNIAVLKRDIYAKPDHYKSGFDIRLIYSNKKDFNILNNLQIITDSYVYEQICDKYKLSTLSAVFVKNQMMTFFELNLKKYIKIPKPKEKSDEDDFNLAKLNIFDEKFDEDDKEDRIYNINAINFNELKCTFKKENSANLIPAIVALLQKKPKQIITLRGEKKLMPETGMMLEELEKPLIYKNIFRVTCYDEMKYKPYGFFYELISNIYNYAQSTKLIKNNDFSQFKTIDKSGFIKDLINLNERTFPHPEDVRYSLFDIFYTIFSSMGNSVIYIEDFEKIDDTSYEILQLIMEKFEELDVSYVITANKEFALHEKSYFLLSSPNYTEVSVKSTSFKEIIEKDLNKYKKILESYHLQKIAQNTKGSPLYFENAICYLQEKEIIKQEKGIFIFEDSQNIFIPTNLKELVQKRLQLLSKKDKNAFVMLSMMLLTGARIDLATLHLLQVPNEAAAIKTLIDKKYIYAYNNSICIRNYNLLKECLISEPIETLRPIAQETLDKVFSSETKSPAETNLYNILEKGKQEFIVWEYLSKLNVSLGDFSAYLNCSIKFLKLLDNHVNENSQKTIEEYKMEVYDNISNLLYKYSPNEIYNITQIILKQLETTTEDKKIIELCNKMLQGCLIGGNYSYAIELVHKILSRLPNASLDPKNENFNSAFFLISLVKIEVLFSIGNLKDCYESANEILEVLTKENIAQIKPQNLSEKQFLDVIFDSMVFGALSNIMLPFDNLDKFIGKITTKIGEVPKIFEMLPTFEKITKGEKIALPQGFEIEDDKFSKIILNFINAAASQDYKTFADCIYQAKISAKINKLSQIELICDLFIGYSYFKLGEIRKSTGIYYSVLDSGTKNGLKLVTLLAWYFISVLKFEQGEIEIALGIANNALVQMEKDSNSSDFMFFLFRIILSKILSTKNEKELAELCLFNAKYIKGKHGLKFEIGETL